MQVKYEIDVLPGHCSILTQFSEDMTHIRFQAEDIDGTLSDWSGWFEIDSETIHLTWAAFWEETQYG